MVLSRNAPVSGVLLRPCVLAAAVLLGGCAPTAPPQPPTPSDIPQLQAALARDGHDVGTRLRLAEAYRRAGQAEGSVTLLEPMLGREPAAAFFLALTREDQGQHAEARRLYRDYLERGGAGVLRQQVRDRLALLERMELEQAVRAAVAGGQEIAPKGAAPRTVGVFPFMLVSENPELRPLGTALAELLTTDLAQTNRLTVLERSQVQQLLNELALGETGRVDPATAARSGHLLGAGTIVQGRVEDVASVLSLQAAVVRVPGDAGEPLRERDGLDRIFEMEKRMALSIYERLGIQLTAAERERVLRRPTSSVQALLALGYGLEAQDAGRYAEARAHFARALQLDPSFVLARTRLSEADAQARATAQPGLLAEHGLMEIENLRRRQLFDAMDLYVADPSARDAFIEAAGAEGATRQGTARIVIRRPGGQP
jgi:tetratricopeptide (TPR) repeat protein